MPARLHPFLALTLDNLLKNVSRTFDRVLCGARLVRAQRARSAAAVRRAALSARWQIPKVKRQGRS